MPAAAAGGVFQRVADALSATPVDGSLSYGTAGFRADAGRLRGALLRVGALAALRSAARGGAAVGVMVTASHNPAGDNGAKVVDAEGGMLCAEWEAVAGVFVNDGDGGKALAELLEGVGGVEEETWGKAVVVVGGDTRESTTGLVAMVVAGVEVVRGDGDGVVDLGICTTPQLHYVVRGRWRGEKCRMAEYYAGLVREYRSLRGDGEQLGEVVVDCANGVGAIALQGVEGVFDGLHVVNRAGDGPLNSECGADYVQKQRIMPTVFGGEEKSWAKDTVWASLDGDADRLVMYRRAAGSADGILLADGDYFATLSAMFINKHLARAGLGDVLIGVAQTAYSNGAATEYLEGLRGVKVVIAKTGVKHLEVAVEKFDIGIYWEPNGHGTIMYSDCMVKRLTETLEECEGEMLESVKVLLSVGRLANQAVGDGVADMLLALAMLSRQGMYFDDWLCTYAERCSANLVVRVADKNVIVTADCDREVVEPTALRASITEVCQGDGRRALVRPSGTEDVVRVYAEAPPGREEDAWIIAKTIARAVFDTCGGVGERV